MQSDFFDRNDEKIVQDLMNQTVAASKSAPNRPFDTVELISMAHSNVFLAKVSFGLDQVFNLLVDTGSSWNWVNSCHSESPGECPDYFYDLEMSSSVECGTETKHIKYGIGEIEGPICTDYIGLYGMDESLSVQMPFIARSVNPYAEQPFFDGILGLAPNDESSGPLLIEYIYGSKSINNKVFAVLNSD